MGAEGASPVCVAVLGVVGRLMRKGEARALGDGLLLPELAAPVGRATASSVRAVILIMDL